ncbi:hypothetical protein FJT64_001502 [Amphibalanus amphitrite]|uniref:Uncharacterized protein n=1 Tax=Amphibalanus amphitrite TaxID=1232801 RepID=A0A6A4X4M6_AMPAM|nr:hypothetical protein FJT64_001502 [Amphibalanus amphitrite]
MGPQRRTRYMPGKEKETAFLFTIDSGMDVLNSGHPRDAKTLWRGCSSTPGQEDAVSKLVEEVEGLRFGSAGEAEAGAEPEADEDQADQAQMDVLEAICPEPPQEVPEGTESLEPAPDEPAPDAEEEAEQERAQLLREAETVHIPSAPSAALDAETGVPATEGAMAHLAGYIARKCGPSFGALAMASEDAPVQTLWTRLRSAAGGLTIPSQLCLDLFNQLEAEFIYVSRVR